MGCEFYPNAINGKAGELSLIYDDEVVAEYKISQYNYDSASGKGQFKATIQWKVSASDEWNDVSAELSYNIDKRCLHLVILDLVDSSVYTVDLKLYEDK